ncbi:MAG: tetratricopeptide repeat protein [Planctomycetes bacterium]|nr:tetratricopeptide repeat protein [Planctomycetota bacterium]
MFRCRVTSCNYALVATTAWVVVISTTPAASAHPEPAVEIDRLTQQLAKEPKRIDLLLQRAHCNAEAGRAADAVSDLDAARQIDPRSRLVRLQRGLVLSQLNRATEAEAELTRYIADGGEDERAWIERARIRAHAGRMNEAVDDFSKALTTSNDLDAFLERGKLHEQAGRLDEAATGYRQGLDRMPRSLVLQLPLIRVETARGRYAAAIQLIDDALATAPVKTDWYLRRAEVHTAAGNEAAAGADLKSAMQEAERMVLAKRTALNLMARARVLAAMKKDEDARRDLQAVRDMAPQLDEARELLATIEKRVAGNKPVAVGAPKESR